LNKEIREKAKSARSIGIKKAWARLSPEDREKRIVAAADGVRGAKEKRSEGMRKYWDTKSTEERKEHYLATFGTEESKAKVAKIVKQIWDNYTPEEKQARLDKSCHSEQARLNRIKNWERLSPKEKREWIRVHLRRRKWQMTGIEMIVAEYLERVYPAQWKYNGCRDCGVIIDGKTPDFININGQKIVLEVFGRYWHKKSEVKPLKAHYKKFGFDCGIIWEEDCYDEDRLNKILSEVYS